MDYVGCSAMALACLERAKIDTNNKDKWTAEAKRWHELARGEKSWRAQKRPSQQVMHAGPMAQQRQQS
jgi:hypothetical protein